MRVGWWTLPLSLLPLEFAGALVPVFFCLSVHAEQVPQQALQYKSELIRNTRLMWGLNAPVSLFAAQIHQESGWRSNAQSPFAAGLAQFTPTTAQWISGVYRSELGEPAPFNPAWAMRALSRYDKHLYDSLSAATDCDRWSFVLTSYNGGLGWLNRDRALTRANRDDDDRWWSHVERWNSGRSMQAFLENRSYVRKVLLVLQQTYADAGWGRGVLCLR